LGAVALTTLLAVGWAFPALADTRTNPLEAAGTLTMRLSATSTNITGGAFRARWSGTPGCSRYDRWTTRFTARITIKDHAFAARVATSTREVISIAGRIDGRTATGWLDSRFVQPNPLDFIDCTTGRVAFTATLTPTPP
jgi:hypothetical protein